MNALHGFLFQVYPYVCFTVFVVGSLIRFDQNQYSWKSDSSQLLRSGLLRWGSNLFHIGVLFLFFGHLVGLFTPHALYGVLMTAATKQMLADVAKADVVIVNPTHYAVALQWKRGSGRAPVCLAKGTDEVAARIRERARDNKVPVFSDPPCARAIHATVEVGQEIRREQFAAVAAAIRFAEKMREKARAGW